ncbi:MAG TPA: transaldolase family protein, partial [archaeon]|nr:transaldolase family protein [archaeon]
MKLFLDSAILSEIEAVYAAGVCDGITMNPSLVKQAVDKLKAKGEKVSLESYIKKALKIAKGTPVSLEVTERDFKGMVAQGKKI